MIRLFILACLYAMWFRLALLSLCHSFILLSRFVNRFFCISLQFLLKSWKIFPSIFLSLLQLLIRFPLPLPPLDFMLLIFPLFMATADRIAWPIVAEKLNIAISIQRPSEFLCSCRVRQCERLFLLSGRRMMWLHDIAHLPFFYFKCTEMFSTWFSLFSLLFLMVFAHLLCIVFFRY